MTCASSIQRQAMGALNVAAGALGAPLTDLPAGTAGTAAIADNRMKAIKNVSSSPDRA